MINWEKPHSEAFIEKHSRSANWYTISTYQRLSESFIERYADKVYWWNIALCQDISAEFVLKHKERLGKAVVKLDNYAAYVFLVFYKADGTPMYTRAIPKKLPDVQIIKDPPSTSETDMAYIKDHAAELYNKYAGSSDNVNSPAHYQTHELECLVEMAYIFGEEALLHFAKCCAWKYRYRAGSKDSAEEDLKKSDFYTALVRYLGQGGHIEGFLKKRRKNS